MPLALTTKQNLSLSLFSDNLLVYDRDAPISYGDLHTGDSVMLVAQNLHDLAPLSPNGGNAPDSQNPLTDPTNVRVLAILKVPALTGDPDTLYQAIAKDIVRAEPCSTSDSGFCRAYDFGQ
jgi:hypothetical protein